MRASARRLTVVRSSLPHRPPACLPPGHKQSTLKVYSEEGAGASPNHLQDHHKLVTQSVATGYSSFSSIRRRRTLIKAVSHSRGKRDETSCSCPFDRSPFVVRFAAAGDSHGSRQWQLRDVFLPVEALLSSKLPPSNAARHDCSGSSSLPLFALMQFSLRMSPSRHHLLCRLQILHRRTRSSSSARGRRGRRYRPMAN